VKDVRTDATVVTVPLLATAWYRRELARRHSLIDSTSAGSWRGLSATLEEVCARARARERPIARAPNVITRALPQPCLSRRPE